MSLKQDIINAIDRFRTTSINHPVGVIWKNNQMSFYQLGKKWVISKVFTYCYKPKSIKGVILPRDIKKLLMVETKLRETNIEYIIVPKELGFDILTPNDSGDPILLEEIRFISISNKLVLWYMSFTPQFKSILKTLNSEFK
jgi:hypothetical protein